MYALVKIPSNALPFFIKDVMPQLVVYLTGLFYYHCWHNAVNLTDGLDGLAMPTVFVAAGFALVAWATGNVNFASYLKIPYLMHAGELLIVLYRHCRRGLTSFGLILILPKFMGDVGSWH